MPYLFELLSSDHHETLQRLDGLLGAPHHRPEDRLRFHELTQELVIGVSKHEAIEEMHFWPAVRDIGEDGAALAEAGLAQELEGKRALDRLDRRTPDDPGFDDMLHGFAHATQIHIAFEQEQVWPVLGARLDDEARRELGARLERARRLAPTHPYPGAPQRAGALKAVGFLTGVVDRLRDRFSGRGKRFEAQDASGRRPPGP